MRIGATPNLPPHLPSPNKRPAAPSPDSAGANRERSPAAAAPQSSQSTQQSDSQRFYSTARDLPFSGRAAISLYLTNADISWQPGESELLGIDLYA